MLLRTPVVVASKAAGPRSLKSGYYALEASYVISDGFPPYLEHLQTIPDVISYPQAVLCGICRVAHVRLMSIFCEATKLECCPRTTNIAFLVVKRHYLVEYFGIR